MHESCATFIEKHMATHAYPGMRVLEIGSKDLNGSPRKSIEPRITGGFYIGLDIDTGTGVDLVCNFAKPIYVLPHELWAYWDMIVCTEVLEHVQDWRMLINNIKMLSRPGGLVLITARGVGFHKHGYPNDYWRFNVEMFKGMFLDFETIELREDDPVSPGVLYFGRRPDCCQAVKPIPVE